VTPVAKLWIGDKYNNTGQLAGIVVGLFILYKTPIFHGDTVMVTPCHQGVTLSTVWLLQCHHASSIISSGL